MEESATEEVTEESATEEVEEIGVMVVPQLANKAKLAIDARSKCFFII
jgi:hypothetical protein